MKPILARLIRSVPLLVSAGLLAILISAGLFSNSARQPEGAHHGAPGTLPCSAGPWLDMCRQMAIIAGLLDTKGIEAALAYASETLRQETDLGTLHFAMHLVGEWAYRKTADLPRTFAYVQPLLAREDIAELALLAGFLHGVEGAFIEAHYGLRPAGEVVGELCGQQALGDPNRLGAYQRRLTKQCLHGAGHGFLHGAANDVRRALADCDALPHASSAAWCHTGVFTELADLYYPPGTLFGLARRPPPFLLGDSMAPLCAGLPDRYRRECSRVIGWSYLRANPADFPKAFALCDGLRDEDHYRLCMTSIAMRHVNGIFRDDFKSSLATCRYARPEHQGLCITAVGVGLIEGAAGFRHQGRLDELCAMAGEKLRNECLRAGDSRSDVLGIAPEG